MRQTDPQAVGEKLLYYRKIHPGTPLHEIADIYEDALYFCPEVDKNETLGSHTVKQYQQELKERAENGDRYAQSLLSGNTWDEPLRD